MSFGGAAEQPETEPDGRGTAAMSRPTGRMPSRTGRAARGAVVAAPLQRLVQRLDRRLRCLQGITEYSASEDCILRMELRCSLQGLQLSDGTRIRTGDKIIELHLWNEHLPTIPRWGPNLGWGLRLRSRLYASLAELAENIAARADCKEVATLHARISTIGEPRSDPAFAIARRLGFESPAEPPPLRAGRRIHDYWEDFLIWGLICAFNPRGLHPGNLHRRRAELWISRRELMARHHRVSAGSAAQPYPARRSGAYRRPAP